MTIHGRKLGILATRFVIPRWTNLRFQRRAVICAGVICWGLQAATNAQVATIANSTDELVSDTATAISVVNVPSPVVLASSVNTSSDLPAMVAAAKARLSPDLLPKPEVAIDNLQKKIERLKQFVNPESENGKLWVQFLRWDELNAELEKKQPDINKLVELEMDMRQNYNGLELSEFVDVRNALTQFIGALRYGRDPDRIVKLLERQLDRLLEKVQEPATSSDIERQFEIGQIMDLLDESGQAREVVNACAMQFAKPNVRVLASDDFLRTRLGRPVAQPSPVHEIILGTDITGQSFVAGSVTPELVSNSGVLNIRLLMSGHFSSDNVGMNRGVKICSLGSAEVCAAESVMLGDGGLMLAGDTVSDAALSTTITGIEHRLRIVEKLARRKVNQQKDLANQIGESRLVNRLRTQFHEQLAEQIATANQTLNKNPPVLARVGLQKPARRSWTSGNYAAVLWRAQSTAQLAATGSCPLPVPADGLTIQIHQSAIYNTADTVMAGRRIRSNQLDNIALQFGDKVPGEIANEASSEPWSITLADFHPVAVGFDDDLIKFTIRTERSEKGDQSLDQAATVVAVYGVETQYGGIQLVRKGDVDIEFSGRADRGTRATILRSFLKNKFEKVFRESLFDRPIRLADELPDSIPDMEIASVKMDDGWLQVTVK